MTQELVELFSCTNIVCQFHEVVKSLWWCPIHAMMKVSTSATTIISVTTTGFVRSANMMEIELLYFLHSFKFIV